MVSLAFSTRSVHTADGLPDPITSEILLNNPHSAVFSPPPFFYQKLTFPALFSLILKIALIGYFSQFLPESLRDGNAFSAARKKLHGGDFFADEILLKNGEYNADGTGDGKYIATVSATTKSMFYRFAKERCKEGFGEQTQGVRREQSQKQYGVEEKEKRNTRGMPCI